MAETWKSSFVVRVDPNCPSSCTTISPATEHKFLTLTTNLVHFLAQTILVVSKGYSDSIVNLQIVSNHYLELLRHWNKAIPTGIIRCIHDFITERARNQLCALAVAACDGDLTCGQLDILSYQLSTLAVRRRRLPQYNCHATVCKIKIDHGRHIGDSEACKSLRASRYSTSSGTGDLDSQTH